MMFHSWHLHIDASECEFLGGRSHHSMKERINTKKGIIEKMPSCNVEKIKC
jgi:hypothetical protein